MNTIASLLLKTPKQWTIDATYIHTSLINTDKFDPEKPDRKKQRWHRYNKLNQIVYPPTKEGEPPRPAEFSHCKRDILMSAKKFWHASVLVRGLSIDEAIMQCEFSKTLAPKIAKEVLLEAQDKAIKEFNVEYKSNLWVAESTVVENFMRENGIRRTARRTPKPLIHRFCDYYVVLREGIPPEHYYSPEQTGLEKLEDYVKELCTRRIKNSLQMAIK